MQSLNKSSALAKKKKLFRFQEPQSTSNQETETDNQNQAQNDEGSTLDPGNSDSIQNYISEIGENNLIV